MDPDDREKFAVNPGRGIGRYVTDLGTQPANALHETQRGTINLSNLSNLGNLGNLGNVTSSCSTACTSRAGTTSRRGVRAT